MIVSLNMNPCIDRMVEIDGFTYGGMNRIRSVRNEGAGKGLHVAIVARRLGLDAVCIGLLPKGSSDIITDRLADENCEYDFVETQGSVRVNTKVRNIKDSIVTELNESGAQIDDSILKQVEELILKYSSAGSYTIMTGSLPPACPAGFYGKLIGLSKGKSILDAEGEKLTEGLKAKPFLIKPNKYELELAIGRELTTPKSVVEGVREIAGDSIAVVSMGGEGAVYADSKSAYYAPALKIEVKSTVGAGDCMVAGLLYGLENGKSAADLFRCGVAGGTAGCMTPGTELLYKDDFYWAMDQIKIEEI